MTASLLIASLALLSVGCSGILPSPVATSSAASTAPAAGKGFLPIAPLTWSRGGEKVVVLLADGTLLDHGVAFGTLASDGSFSTRDGKRRLTMTTDGAVHARTGLDVQIAEDGTATTKVHGQPDETVSLEQVQKSRGGQPGFTLEGGSPALRRTAMWALMIPDVLRILASGE